MRRQECRNRQAVQRKGMGMCALKGRHVQRTLSAAAGVLIPSAKCAHGRRKQRVDPVAGPRRQGRQNLCSIAQQVLRRRGLGLRHRHCRRHGGGC